MKFTTAILLLAAACTALAQNPGRGAPPIKSPEVSADGKVTFRLRAPNAKEVFVTGIGQRLAMQMDDKGVWTATTDTLKPDIYTYSFSVDGLTVNDPANPLFKTSYGSAGNSLVHVPGPVSWEPAPGVARGALTRHSTTPPSRATIATTGSTRPPTTTRSVKRPTLSYSCSTASATNPDPGSTSAPPT